MNVSDTVQRSGSITKTLICVDSVQNGEPSGFLYNPYMPNRTAFFGYFSFIRVMDGFLTECSVHRLIRNIVFGKRGIR